MTLAVSIGMGATDMATVMIAGPASIARPAAGAPPPEFQGNASIQAPRTSAVLRADEWSAALRAKFALVRTLKAGWDGPRSRAVSPVLLYKIDRVLRDSLAGGAIPPLPLVVPSPEGGVQIEWRHPTLELEVYFGPHGEISALLEDLEAGTEIEKTDRDAIDLLVRWAPRFSSAARDEAVPVGATTSSDIKIAA